MWHVCTLPEVRSESTAEHVVLPDMVVRAPEKIRSKNSVALRAVPLARWPKQRPVVLWSWAGRPTPYVAHDAADHIRRNRCSGLESAASHISPVSRERPEPEEGSGTTGSGRSPSKIGLRGGTRGSAGGPLGNASAQTDAKSSGIGEGKNRAATQRWNATPR